MNRLRIASIAALCAAIFTTGTAFAGAVTYKTNENNNIPVNVCGTVLTMSLHEIQQYTLNPNGQLNFHYIANGEITGNAPDGKKIRVNFNNKEVDHIFATTPPDLGPYGGSLQGWVAANAHEIVEINAQYNERWIVKGTGRVLDNHWVFEVNHTGTQVDTVKFTGGCP